MTKKEIYFTGIVLGIIGILGYINMQNSQVLARDIQRKNDAKHIAAALDNYLKENGNYPISKDGKILACQKDGSLVPCDWGQNNLVSTNSAYLKPIPQDPRSPKHDYYYVSNTKSYQIYASLERQEDSEYNQSVAQKNLPCGQSICNFGVASSGISLTDDLPQFKKVD